MARLKKTVTPNLLKNPTKNLKAAQETIGAQILGATAKELSSDSKITVTKVTPKYLEVAERQMAKRGMVDLKIGFANSSKKKISKDGKSWYLDIPIRRKVASITPRSAYQDMLGQTSGMEVGESRTLSVESLITGNTTNTLSSLSYQRKSDDIKAIKVGERRTNYVAFRRVSSKSDPASWILNREAMNSSNTSATMQKKVARLIKFNADKLKM